MKCMTRNKTKFYYAQYSETVPITDEYGNETGEKSIQYSDPVECYGNISAARGETETMQFGENVAYDKIIVMDDDAPSIDEYTALWVDEFPHFDSEGAIIKDEDGNVIPPHDYTVKKVAKSLNSVSIAISKVNIGG